MTALFLTLALAGCAHVSQSAAQTEREILHLEALRRDAQVRGDWQTIQQLNAPDFSEVAGNGGFRTGAENSDAMRTGRLKFTSVEFSEQRVRSHGDVAWITGVANRTGSFDGVPFNQYLRYTRIYVRQNGAWRAVFAQNTRIEAAR